MPVSSRLELVDALASSSFDALLGTAESSWLEFKGEPYPIEGNRGKWELAKDVAAFANGGGGCLVIGVQTTKSELERRDKATAIREVPKRRIDRTRYADVINRWMFPPPVGLFLKWYPEGEEHERGLFLIAIDSQPTQSKYFIVRMLDDQDREIGAIGVPIRDEDGVRWLPAEHLQHLISRGLQAQTPSTGVATASQELVQEAETRLEALEKTPPWDTVPYYALQAVPSDGSPPLDNIFDHDGPLGVLEEPSPVREQGFHFGRRNNPQPLESGIEVSHGHRSVLRLEHSGILTAFIAATRDWLGWAINDGRNPDAPTVLNAIPFVETTLEFFRILERIRPTSSAYTVRVRCRRFAEPPGVHSPILPPRFGGFLADPRAAITSDLRRDFHTSGDAAADAFVALRQAYGAWGLGAQAIPLTEGGRVVAEMIVGTEG